MATALRPASLAGAPLDRYFHVCAFVRGRDEERRVLGPFVREAVEGGEKVLYIVDPALLESHRAGLRGAGVAPAEGQLEVLTWFDTYLESGTRFEATKMLTTIERVMQEAGGQSFPRLRIVGQMGWAFANHPGVEDLIEYEVRVNEVLARTRNPAVCVYDVDRLTGTMMMDLLRAHPLTVVGGTLYENPFFTAPEEMLAEVRQRRAAARA